MKRGLIPDLRKKTAPVVGTTEVNFVGNEIFITRPGEEAQPLLLEKRFSIEISDESRLHLARKIARLVANIVDAQKFALLDYTVRVLEVFCRDQLLRVREILAQELKDMPQAPHEIMVVLAQDEAVSVSVPVLECSPVLTDEDLVQIIRSYKHPEVLEAIAGRRRLSGLISDMLAETSVARAISRLLSNEEAEIGDETFEHVTEMATSVPMLHEPLLRRPDLPLKMINRIALFVSESLVQALVSQGVLSPRVKKVLEKAVKERLENPSVDKERQGRLDATDLFKSGRLDADAIDQALDENRTSFVHQALVLMSGYDSEIVGRILKTQNPKAITALCWKAGFSMRQGIQVQTRMARIHHTKVLLAKGGKDYPLSDQEMMGFLEFYG